MEDRTPLVCVGSPIQNRQHTILKYLDHIYELDYPKNKILLAFYVNNSTDKTYECLETFRDSYMDEYYNILLWDETTPKEYVDDQTRESFRDYSEFAYIRNRFIQLIYPYPWQYLLSVDSDILVEPNTIKTLINNNKDIIASLVYHKRIYWLNEYNILLNGKNNIARHINFDSLPKPIKPFRVDVTGECYLINRRVFDSGVRYHFHKQGEDVAFCQDAQEHGFSIYCDPSVRPWNLY